MGKLFNFFVLFGDLVSEMREFIDTLKSLNGALEGVRDDLKKESIHRETIYRLIVEDALRKPKGGAFVEKSPSPS